MSKILREVSENVQNEMLQMNNRNRNKTHYRPQGDVM